MSQSQVAILKVEGMTCPSCIRHVEAALHEIEGIGKVKVELKEGKVVVEHDPASATTEQMISALAEAGYASRTAGS